MVDHVYTTALPAERSRFHGWLKGIWKVGNIHSGTNATHLFYTVIGMVVATILSTVLSFAGSRIFDTGGTGIALEHRLTGIEDKQNATNDHLDKIDKRLDSLGAHP